MAAKALLIVALVGCVACLAVAEPGADGGRKLRQVQPQPPYQQQPTYRYPGFQSYYYGQPQTYYHPRLECAAGEYKTWRADGVYYCRTTIDLPTNINEYPARDQQSIEHCPQEQIIHYLTSGEFGCAPQAEVYKGMCAAAVPAGGK